MMEKEEYEAIEKSNFEDFKKSFVKNGLITIAVGFAALSLNLGIKLGEFKYKKELKKDSSLRLVYQDILAENWSKLRGKGKYLGERIVKVEEKLHSFEEGKYISYGLALGAGAYYLLSFMVSNSKHERKKKSLEASFNENKI